MWLEGGDKYRACVLVNGVAIVCVDVPKDRGEQAAITAIDALIPAGIRSSVRHITSETPITDVAVMVTNDDPPENERITKRIELTDDLIIAPILGDLAALVADACQPPGYNRFPAVTDLRVFPYAFMRLNAPRQNPYTWDSDERLQTAIALSRLIRPTSISFGSSGRLIGDPSDPDFQIVPGPASGLGGEAWVADPKRNWLSPGDAVELAALMKAFTANPFTPGTRIVTALWYHEYAARTRLIDVRFPLIATALESLISTSNPTRHFIYRVPQLADKLGLPPLARDDISRIWGRRSSLVHGAKHGGLDDEDFRIYGRMEDVLRGVLRRAITDLGFRATFDSVEAINAALPVPRPVAVKATCPNCEHVFAPDEP